MRIRRDVSSIPHRSATETWQRITALISGSGSNDIDQLERATGVMASIITDEHPGGSAILMEGVGPQLRIYCRYGMKAVEAGDAIDPLTWNPTAGDWTMHVPCDAANIDWVRTSLRNTSPRIKVFDVVEDNRTEAEEETTASSAIVVDWNPKGQ